MCGIFGIVSSRGEHFVSAEKQLNCISHRGPDDQGSWSAEGVFLGNCRLSIIDLAGGHQPIFNDDKSCCIVYNGELYNFQDLRSELVSLGYRFHSKTDTEVVLRAYEEWGVQCFKRFNGMFAFAIWDQRKKHLVAARDRIGEKPFYYYKGINRFVFASEIKAIVADGTIPRNINPKGLANYLAFGHSVAPNTMFENIYKLLPGHYMIAHENSIDVIPYWDVGDEPQVDESEHIGYGDYCDKIREILDDSVRRRIVADVPVGAFLSGGIDSSVVVALMKRHASGPVKTFSLGFTVGGGYNELSDARRVAEFLGTEHHELRVDHLDLVGTLQKLVYQYDEPFGDAANFPVYLLSEFARKEVKVVLAGEGGDELFGGYRRYVADQFAPLYQKLPATLRENILPNLVNSIPRFRRLKRIVSTLPDPYQPVRYAKWLEVFTPEMRSRLLHQDWLRAIGDHDPRSSYAYYYHLPKERKALSDHLNRIMYVDVKTWLVDTFMEKVDKATMAFGLEGRLPLLDYRLVELAFQIPAKFKIRGISTKRILKDSVRDILPPSVLSKRKHGFAVPTDPWFRGELKGFLFETLLDRRTTARGYFNQSEIEKLYCLHKNGQEVFDTPLWLLLNFELWNREFIDGH
ncbi:MAG: asparagine synthase (glutamine-hydrolyzing) [Ignavibacteriales bacterium]|nr:asparagine synthase (glutamine-hydrolyzing) [Ignavibacteriales bacterium]